MGRESEDKNERRKKEVTFCLRSKGMAKGGEERRGEEMGPDCVSGVTPVSVQIYAL